MSATWDGYGEARMPTTCDVYEDDPQPTGLLDRWGNPLIRQREPIGFRLSGHAPKHGKHLLSCPIHDAVTNDTQEDRG